MARSLGIACIIALVANLAAMALSETGIPASWLEVLRRVYRSSELTRAAADAQLMRWLQLAVIGAVAVAMAWCVVDIQRGGQKFLVLVFAVVLVAGLSVTLAFYGVFHEPYSGIAAAVVAWMGGLGYRRSQRGQRHRRLWRLFGTRVEMPLFRRLMRSAAAVPLEGGERVVSLVVCRIVGTEGMRENLDVPTLAALSNHFLGAAAERLKQRGGYIDELGADGVRAIFGALEGDEAHAVSACEAALELRDCLEDVRAECVRLWSHPVEFGIAVVSGPMTLGVFGTGVDEHFGGAGQPVDFARRLSLANAGYGSRVLVAAQTRQLAPDDIELRPMEMFYDAESSQMHEIYELLARKGALSDEEAARRDAFWQGIVYLRERDLEAAREQFRQAGHGVAEDPPLQYFQAKVEWLLAGGVEDEPPAGGADALRPTGTMP